MKIAVATPHRSVPSNLQLEKSPPLAFFFLCIYTALAFLRFHEYGGVIAPVPVLPVFFVTTFLFWLTTERKNLNAPHFGIMLGLLISVTISFLGATRWPGGTVRIFADFATTTVFFLMVATTVNTPRRMGVFTSILAFCLLFIAVHCFDQMATGIGWSGAVLSQGTRATYIGIFNDPNDLALTFLAVIPITVGWIVKRGGVTRKLFGIAFVAAYIYGIYLTNSRGAVVALAGMMVLASVVKFRSFKSLLLLPIIGAFLLAVAPSRVAELDGKDGSASERVDAWYAGYQMFQKSPIFGVGQNRFPDNHTITAHNSFIQAMSELGFFGHFFWVSLLTVTFIMLYRVYKLHRSIILKRPEGINRELFDQSITNMYTAMYSLIGTLIASMFLSRAYALMLYILIALIVANYGMLKKACPNLQIPTFKKLWLRCLAVQLLGMFVMWLVIKVLLGMN
jgi:putative inorganic carbon (hco3(-)) transporter